MFHANIDRTGTAEYFVSALESPGLARVSSSGGQSDAVERLRRWSLGLIAASIGVAAMLAVATGLSVNVVSAGPVVQVIAAGVLASAVGATTPSLTRIGDCLGPFALVILSGIICGFISLMGLHLHFALLDNRLLAADRMLGFNDPALVAWLSRTPNFVHGLMNLAYSNTVPVLLGSLILQAWRRERTEIWRSVFCFTGTLLTVCVLSIATPAKGLGLWVSDADLARLPGGAARYFWPAFNRYYDGTATHIQIDSIGAVVSFPSFHVIMGMIVLAIWRKQRLSFALALAWFGAMLPAAVALGGHYVVDLLGGVAIWTAWFAVSRKAAPKIRSDGSVRENPARSWLAAARQWRPAASA